MPPSIQIAHVQYIKIPAWPLGFLVIFLFLVWFSLCSSLFRELRDNGVVKNLQFWPQSVGVIRILIYRMWVIVCAWEAWTILNRARDWVGVVSNCSMDCFSLRSSCFRFLLTKQRNHPRHARGGTPGNSRWDCAAWFSTSWPYFRPKSVIFRKIHPFSDLASLGRIDVIVT